MATREDIYDFLYLAGYTVGCALRYLVLFLLVVGVYVTVGILDGVYDGLSGDSQKFSGHYIEQVVFIVLCVRWIANKVDRWI